MFYFLTTSIQANSLIAKAIMRSFILVNTMRENKNKSFNDIVISFLRLWYHIMVCDHDLMNKTKMKHQ